MNTSPLLHWHYMIFLLPFGAAAFFLLLSSLRLGGHRSGHRGGGAARAPAAGAHHGGHGAAPAGHEHHHHGIRIGHHSWHRGGGAGGHGCRAGHGRGGKTADGRGAKEAAALPPSLFVGLLGIGRAPLPMVLEMFCIAWGLTGLWANQLVIRIPEPSFVQMLPALGIALAGGIIGARIAAEAMARLLPRDETAAISRDALFGLAGKVVFPTSESAGRIHVYDAFGTLHDETCRVAPGEPPIPKDRTALIIDIDVKGNLIVEEIA